MNETNVYVIDYQYNPHNFVMLVFYCANEYRYVFDRILFKI